MKSEEKEDSDGGVPPAASSILVVDHGDRSRRGRAERHRDGHRACRALRPLAAAPASRAHRPRRRKEHLHPDRAENPGEDARVRLETMVRTTNGFEIAETDLKLRGPGEFFGTRQHGRLGFTSPILCAIVNCWNSRGAKRFRWWIVPGRRAPAPVADARSRLAATISAGVGGLGGKTRVRNCSAIAERR